MCLLVHPHNVTRPVVSNFWKVVCKGSRLPPRYNFYSPFMSYKKGEIVKADKIVEPVIRSLGKDCIKQVHGGAIHVCVEKSKAEGYARMLEWEAKGHRTSWLSDRVNENTEFEILRVKCLPKHFIAWGLDGDACYTQVEVLD